MKETNVGGHVVATNPTNEETGMLPANINARMSSVPDTTKLLKELMGMKNRVSNACQELMMLNPNDDVTGAICQILIEEIDQQLQPRLVHNDDVSVTPMPLNESLNLKGNLMISKKLDTAIMKFPLPMKKQPRMTLQQAFHIANWICSGSEKSGDAIITEICTLHKKILRDFTIRYINN